MIKSKPRNKYYGTLAYADGEVKQVVEYVKSAHEFADGIKTQEYWRLKGDGYYTKIVSVEAYKIMTALDTVTAVVKVDGRTYIGHAQCNPSDQFSGAFGRQLALARALHDNATIQCLMEYTYGDSDGDSSDIDSEPSVEVNYYITADGEDDENFVCCSHCGKCFNLAKGGFHDDYTDDVYCCHDCYINAGGNIDPDGEDDDVVDTCDYCLNEIRLGDKYLEDADGHQYCCQECYEHAMAEKENDSQE